jgi:hypothetical protein
MQCHRRGHDHQKKIRIGQSRVGVNVAVHSKQDPMILAHYCAYSWKQHLASCSTRKHPFQSLKVRFPKVVIDARTSMHHVVVMPHRYFTSNLSVRHRRWRNHQKEKV